MTRTRTTNNWIEDAVLRAEMSAPTALEIEEARQIKQEEMMRECNLWEDPVKSHEILGRFADSAKAIDALKDLKYKAEEAKLISELVEVEGINYQLFDQAYNASLDVNKFLDQYEMAKLLKGPFDKEGACVIIKAGSDGVNSEIWAEQLLNMYIKWAKKLGYKSRLVEKHPSVTGYGGIQLATIEFEFECAYGYLSGERGIHLMINSQNGSVHYEEISAYVDVVPLFLGTSVDIEIDDKDLIISSLLLRGEKNSAEPTVCIQHIPTSISVQSSGERSQFANKIKALNRLKAKLLVIAEELKLSDVSSIKDTIMDVCYAETRRYVSHPYKMVQDVKTGIQLPDLNSFLDGNIEPLIGAHIRIRHTS
ncbi:peptide chain release factor PrfB3, chloroplastic isoform X2 [Jatropha curcas]|uniref:peptide chain release factor PrfB3, chloroplastic isoform X2 n=1 Tax=Jatropha curcas TaxID=180498 RepID=UPI0005FBAF5A|nr:peptide chain release factor PrfB3, chloroplastic isoform X2 [Jatropha curcas]